MSVRPSGLLALAAALTACAATAGPAASGSLRWAGDAARPPPATLGLAALDAAAAMWGAASGTSLDPRWQCSDSAPDLRATSPSTRVELAPLGPTPPLVFAAVVLSFTSPARGYAPDEVIDVPGAPGARVFFQARALVSPDGHLGWMEVSPPDPDRPRPWAYLSAIEQPATDRAALGTLPPGFAAELLQLIASATSPACDVPIATVQDVERLPYALDRDARDLFAARSDALRRKLPRFCATARHGAGPWEVHVSHVEAGYRTLAGSVATLRARVHLQGGAPCLGPVEVPRVGRE